MAQELSSLISHIAEWPEVPQTLNKEGEILLFFFLSKFSSCLRVLQPCFPPLLKLRLFSGEFLIRYHPFNTHTHTQIIKWGGGGRGRSKQSKTKEITLKINFNLWRTNLSKYFYFCTRCCNLPNSSFFFYRIREHSEKTHQQNRMYVLVTF